MVRLHPVSKQATPTAAATLKRETVNGRFLQSHFGAGTAHEVTCSHRCHHCQPLLHQISCINIIRWHSMNHKLVVTRSGVTDLREVTSGKQEAQASLHGFGDCWAGVPPHCLYTLCIKPWRHLQPCSHPSLHMHAHIGPAYIAFVACTQYPQCLRKLHQVGCLLCDCCATTVKALMLCTVFTMSDMQAKLLRTGCTCQWNKQTCCLAALALMKLIHIIYRV